MIGSLDNILVFGVSLLVNRVTSNVFRRVPPTYRPQHLDFHQFVRYLQYLQLKQQRFVSKTTYPTGDLGHTDPTFFSSRLREPTTHK